MSQRIRNDRRGRLWSRIWFLRWLVRLAPRTKRLRIFRLRVTRLRQECDRLRGELDELVRYTDAELQYLTEERDWLHQAWVQEQARVAELEAMVEWWEQEVVEARWQDTCDRDLQVDAIEPQSAWMGELPLAGVKLAIVGGHDETRRSVLQELQEQHGLRDWVEVPPFRQASLGVNKLRAKLRDCDWIVVITGYMNHKVMNSIDQLKRKGALQGKVILLDCRGKSGVVREILKLVADG